MSQESPPYTKQARWIYYIGYIGGDVLHAILREFPRLRQSSITCLVRTQQGGELLRRTYPSLDIVQGDLANLGLLEDLASSADIVLHCASIEDVASSRALAQGLARRRQRSGPAFYICTSGTDILSIDTIHARNYGEPTSGKVYDDWDGLEKVLSLPDDSPHKEVEDVQRAASSPRVKVAIVCAPCVYGRGSGCGNQRSIQLPDLTRYVIERGTAFTVGRGLSRWSNVHIHDLSDIYVLLVGQALTGGGGGATWGRDGYYFAENGAHVWSEVAGKVAREAQAQGLVDSVVDVVSWSPGEEADKHLDCCTLFYGTDSVCRADRARRLLGWSPRWHSIEQEVALTLAAEARKKESSII